MTDPVIEIPFSGGIDQYTRRELADASSSFPLLENVRQERRGGAVKRYGYRDIGKTRLDGSTRVAGRRLLATGDQICTIDGAELDVYVPSLAKFVARAKVPEAGYRLISMPSFGTQTVVSDVITTGTGYVVTAQLQDIGGGGGWNVIASVSDIASGVVVRGPEEAAEAPSLGQVSMATFGANNEKVALLYGITTPFNIVTCAILDTTSATTIAAGWFTSNITAPATTGQVVAVCLPTKHTDRFAVAFDSTSGTSRLTVVTVGAAGVIDTVSINTSSISPTIGTVDMTEQGSTLWVCWAQGHDLHAIGLDPANLSGAAVATAAVVVSDSVDIELAHIATRPGGGALVFAYGGTFQIQNVKIAAGAAASDGQSQVIDNAILCGRPFLRGSQIYGWFSSDSNNREEMVLCEVDCPVSSSSVQLYLRPVVSPVVRGLIDETRFTDRRCRTAPVAGANTMIWAWPAKRTGLSDGIAAAMLDFTDFEAWSSAQHHASLAIGGGVTMIFDGARCTESNFLCRPGEAIPDTSVSGSQTFTNGGRSYVAVYARPDANGNLHISGVSPPSGPCGNCTSKKVIISAPGINITACSDGDVEVWVYGTADGGAAPYTFVGKAQSRTDVQVTVEDTRVEADVPAFALLYGTGNLPETNGSSQDHHAPPGLYSLTSYNGMLCGITGQEVWFCSQPVYGEAVWWTPVFAQQFDDDLTGLFVMDGALYATTRRSIYTLSGSPPSDAGTDGGLSAPSKLSVDRGCVSARSIVVTSAGAMFRSEGDIELFRAGAIQPLGYLVADVLDAYPTVTSAVFDTTRGLARMSLAAALDSNGFVRTAADSGGGRDVIFDVIRGVWVSSDRKHGAGDDDASQDAALVSSAGSACYAWLGADGSVYLEDTTTKRDPGPTWVAQAAETGWIHIAGLQGEQFIDRLLLLMERASDHALSISLAFDYGDFGAPKVFTATQINALPREWLDREITQTTSQAVRIRIEDSQDVTLNTGHGEGATWIAITLSGTPHRGVKRTSGAQRGG